MACTAVRSLRVSDCCPPSIFEVTRVFILRVSELDFCRAGCWFIVVLTINHDRYSSLVRSLLVLLLASRLRQQRLSLPPLHMPLGLLPVEIILPQVAFLALILGVDWDVCVRALYLGGGGHRCSCALCVLLYSSRRLFNTRCFRRQRRCNQLLRGLLRRVQLFL